MSEPGGARAVLLGDDLYSHTPFCRKVIASFLMR